MEDAGGHALAGQPVTDGRGAALGQALVVVLGADVTGVADDLDGADVALAQALHQRGQFRLGGRRQHGAVEGKKGFAAQRDLVADHLRFGQRCRLGDLAADLDVAIGLHRAVGRSEVITPEQARTRVVAVAAIGRTVEGTLLAMMRDIERQAVAGPAEELLHAHRCRGLAGGFITEHRVAALVVEAAAHAQQRILEEVADAEADAVLVRVLEQLRHGFGGQFLAPGTTAFHAGDDLREDVRTARHQALVAEGARVVKVERGVALFQAEADGGLAVVEHVPVGGQEHLADQHAVGRVDGVVHRPSTPQPVVGELQAAGATLSEPALAEEGAGAVIGEDAEDLAQHVPVLVDAQADPALVTGIGDRNDAAGAIGLRCRGDVLRGGTAGQGQRDGGGQDAAVHGPTPVFSELDYFPALCRKSAKSAVFAPDPGMFRHPLRSAGGAPTGLRPGFPSGHRCRSGYGSPRSCW
jgi:hypothetical protein